MSEVLASASVRDEVIAAVRDVICDDSAEVRDSDFLDVELAMDSLDVSDLVYKLESRFSVSVRDSVYGKLDVSVADVTAAVEAALARG